VTSALAAVVVKLRANGQLGASPIYVRPAQRPAGSIFESLTPSGVWRAVYVSGGDKVPRVIDLAPAADGATWSFAETGRSTWDDDQLSSALGGRHASARYVFASRYLAWWIVRFDDGTEAAVPLAHQGSVYVDGSLLEAHLYPAATIFGEARSGGE
jgi:hypothetical protein